MNSNTNEKMTLTAEDYKNFKSIRTLNTALLALSIVCAFGFVLLLFVSIFGLIPLLGAAIGVLIISIMLMVKMNRYSRYISRYTTYLVLLILGIVLVVGGILTIIASALIMTDNDIKSRCEAPTDVSQQTTVNA